MPSIPGTIVAAPVTTGDTANTHAIGSINEMQGGQHTAANVAARDAITAERRMEGMTCWVVDQQKLYRLVGGTSNASWQQVSNTAPQYVHDQATPSSLWDITHNLGGYPAVSVVDSANRVGFGQVDYVSVNRLTVAFSASFSGKAYLVL